jgi:hypothetical protein
MSKNSYFVPEFSAGSEYAKKDEARHYNIWKHMESNTGQGSISTTE